MGPQGGARERLVLLMKVTIDTTRAELEEAMAKRRITALEAYALVQEIGRLKQADALRKLMEGSKHGKR